MLRPSKKQVARGCGQLLGCGVASTASQNRLQVMLCLLSITLTPQMVNGTTVHQHFQLKVSNSCNPRLLKFRSLFKKMTLNVGGGGHQRSFGRFLVCLFIWFIILTQCGTYWIYETIDKIVNIDNNNNQEVGSSEKSINNEVQKPRNPSGIENTFCLHPKSFYILALSFYRSKNVSTSPNVLCQTKN